MMVIDKRMGPNMHSGVAVFLASGQTIRKFSIGKAYTNHKLAYRSAKIKKEFIGVSRGRRFWLRCFKTRNRTE